MSRITDSNHAVLVPKTVSQCVESQSAQDEDKIVTWRDAMPDPPQSDFEDAQIGIVHQLPVLYSCMAFLMPNSRTVSPRSALRNSRVTDSQFLEDIATA